MKKRKDRQSSTESTLLHFFTPANKKDVIVIDDDDVKTAKRAKSAVTDASLFGQPSSVLRPRPLPVEDTVVRDGQASHCPVCTQPLPGLSLTDIQAHVNACLDDSPPVPLEKSQSVPLDEFQSVSLDEFQSVPLDESPPAPLGGSSSSRTPPSYKILQGMPIAVDAFCYGSIPGITAYFLTHAHADHYTRLAASWACGPIYCSEGTATLIVHMLAVDPKWVRALPLDVATAVPGTGGVRVTLIEANHCPGSCLFLFEGAQGRYLHCGDFRASPRHVLHPAVRGTRLDLVYLDTTYLDPKYAFPPQPQVVAACAELARRLAAGTAMDRWVQSKGRLLVVVGTYTIGKERIVKAIARALQSKVYCDARKAAVLRCEADPELDALLTGDAAEASVHVVPLGMVTPDRLGAYVERFKGFSRVVGIRPTGWTYRPAAGSERNPTIASVIAGSQQGTFTHEDLRPGRNGKRVLVYGVPYSEHSSFFELTCFALSLNWGKMIATVKSEHSGEWMEKWARERRNDTIIAYREADYW